MSFEKKVLLAVAEVTGEDDAAQFTHGTLFVHCDERMSKRIVRKLCQLNVGMVQVNGPINDEYAFDFVA